MHMTSPMLYDWSVGGMAMTAWVAGAEVLRSPGGTARHRHPSPSVNKHKPPKSIASCRSGFFPFPAAGAGPPPACQKRRARGIESDANLVDCAADSIRMRTAH